MTRASMGAGTGKRRKPRVETSDVQHDWPAKPIGVLAATRYDFDRWLARARKIVAAADAKKLILILEPQDCMGHELSATMRVPGFENKPGGYDLYQLARTRVR